MDGKNPNHSQSTRQFFKGILSKLLHLHTSSPEVSQGWRYYNQFIVEEIKLREVK